MEREPGGTWLLVQIERGDWIDELAAASRFNRGFSHRGDAIRSASM